MKPISPTKGIWFLVILAGCALIFSSVLILMPVPFQPVHLVVIVVEFILGTFIIGVGFEQITLPDDDEDE